MNIPAFWMKRKLNSLNFDDLVGAGIFLKLKPETTWRPPHGP